VIRRGGKLTPVGDEVIGLLAKSPVEMTPEEMEALRSGLASPRPSPQPPQAAPKPPLGTPPDGPGKVSPTPSPQTAPKSPRGVITLTELLRSETEAPSELINYSLYPGMLWLLAGEGGVGKTLWSLFICLCLAVGRAFGPWRAPRPLRTLYIQSETPVALLKRHSIQPMCRGLEITENKNFLLPTEDFCFQLDDRDGLIYLENRIKIARPDMAVIDSLVDYHGQDENSAAMAKVLLALKDIGQRHNTLFKVLHHAKKRQTENQTKDDDLWRGSKAIFDKADVFHILTKHSDDDVLKLQAIKHKFGPKGPPVYLKRDSKTFLHSVATINRKINMQEVIAALQNIGGANVREADLVRELQHRHPDVSKSTAERAVRLAVEEGQIRKETRGRKSLLFTL
jgi:hypothetical protein